jgi:hypothetical protein
VQLFRLDSAQRAHGVIKGVPLYVSVWAVNQRLQTKKYGRFCICDKLRRLLRVIFNQYGFKLLLPIDLGSGWSVTLFLPSKILYSYH